MVDFSKYESDKKKLSGIILHKVTSKLTWARTMCLLVCVKFKFGFILLLMTSLTCK